MKKVVIVEEGCIWEGSDSLLRKLGANKLLFWKVEVGSTDFHEGNKKSRILEEFLEKKNWYVEKMSEYCERVKPFSM